MAGALEQVQTVFAEFAQRYGIDSFALDEEGTLTLTLDDILYVMQYNRELETLVLVAGVGKVPLEARAMVFGQLLAANLFWGETGGCTLAYEPSEELVVLQYSLDADGLTAAVFEQAFDGIRGLALEWRERLGTWVEAEIAGPTLEQYVNAL